MKERRSGIRIMGSLIGLVRPLMGRMFAAVTLGVLGYLCAIFLTILAGCAILHGLTMVGAGGIRLTEQPGFLISLPFGTVFTVMGIMAVLRGITRNNTVTIILHSNCWLLSGTECLRPCAGYVRQNWREETRGT